MNATKVFGDKDLTNLTNFLSPTYIQHNPNVKDGPEGLREFLESDPMKQREKRKMDIRHVIAEGDYVWYLKWKIELMYLKSFVLFFNKCS